MRQLQARFIFHQGMEFAKDYIPRQHVLDVWRSTDKYLCHIIPYWTDVNKARKVVFSKNEGQFRGDDVDVTCGFIHQNLRFGFSCLTSSGRTFELWSQIPSRNIVPKIAIPQRAHDTKTCVEYDDHWWRQSYGSESFSSTPACQPCGNIEEYFMNFPSQDKHGGRDMGSKVTYE